MQINLSFNDMLAHPTTMVLYCVPLISVPFAFKRKKKKYNALITKHFTQKFCENAKIQVQHHHLFWFLVKKKSFFVIVRYQPKKKHQH
jgi:hypothetical protein